MTADAILSVRFKTAAEGGRHSPLAGLEVYHCPVVLSGEAFDCRVMVRGRVIELGSVYELPVRFLCFDLVAPLLRPGTPISLLEGREVATGTIVKVFRSTPVSPRGRVGTILPRLGVRDTFRRRPTGSCASGCELAERRN